MDENVPGFTGVIEMINRWRGKIILFVIVATLISLAVALLLPKKYLSTAVVFPSNTFLTDKGHIFNNNIQQLYSPYGASDDLDRLYAIATSSPLFISIADSLKLAEHYNLENTPEKLQRAARMLKKTSSIMKSENGELRIQVWDRDNSMAAEIANAMLVKIQATSNDLIMQSGATVLNSLKQASHVWDDSAGINSGKALYEQQVKELQVNLGAQPPAFVVLEKPGVSLTADKPDILLIVIATFLLSCLFSILTTLIVERTQ